MANLKTPSLDKIGEFVRELCRDRKRCEKMAKDMNFATSEFAKVMPIPTGHKIMIHLDEEKVTHVIIPTLKDIEEAEAEVRKRKSGYPPSYVDEPLTVFSNMEEPERAFAFRLGEYTMRRCKN